MFNVEGLLGSLIGGALGARGKPHARVAQFLRPGRSSFLNTGTILTAAALGWGAYEIWRTQSGRSGAALNATIGGTGPIPPSTQARTPPSMPPPMPRELPGSTSSAGFSGPFSTARSSVEVVANPSDGVGRIAGLLIAAARSDGELGEEEYGRILSEARAAGADKDVMKALSDPRPLEAIVSGVADPKLASDLYVLAFAVVRADGTVNPAERAWLARLAGILGLDAGSVERLETEAARRIAATN